MKLDAETLSSLSDFIQALNEDGPPFNLRIDVLGDDSFTVGAIVLDPDQENGVGYHFIPE